MRKKRNAWLLGLLFSVILLLIVKFRKKSVSKSKIVSASYAQLASSKDGRYKLWRNILLTGSGYESKVGIATQCDINKLNYLHELCKSWPGPISVAIFVTGDDVHKLSGVLSQVFCCGGEHVHFHVVFPVSHPPFHVNLKIGISCMSVKCDGIDSVHMESYNKEGVPYPVNLLRNTAVDGSSTSHVMVLDIDITPDPNLYNNLNQLTLPSTNLALVVPVFEIENEVTLPSTKKELLSLWKDGLVRPFYFEVCENCQQATDYLQWKSTSDEMYSVTWSYPWEPFYVASREHVKYDERFEQYGFNRVSQLCEFYLRGGTFHVYSRGFCVHHGFKRPNRFHQSKSADHKRNKMLYRKFKEKLYEIYKNKVFNKDLVC